MSNEKRKYEAIDLIEYMDITITIACFGCEKEHGSWFDDEADFAKDCFKEGWRATKQGDVYCPECAKKKLKK